MSLISSIVNASMSGASVDRELLVTSYIVKTYFADAAVGNFIRRTDVIELGAVVTVVAVLWANETTGLDITAPPSITGFLTTITAGDSLTQAQIMGSGLATSANQLAALGYLADLAGNPYDKLTSYRLRNTEDLGVGTKYIFKTNGISWLMLRKSYTASSSVTEYASVKNNITFSETGYTEAWNARASINYSELSSV